MELDILHCNMYMTKRNETLLRTWKSHIPMPTWARDFNFFPAAVQRPCLVIHDFMRNMVGFIVDGHI